MHSVWKTVLLAALFFAAPSWAVNKCMGPDGAISYQDVECQDGKGDRLKITDNQSDSGPSGFHPGESGSAHADPPHLPFEKTRSLSRSDPVIYTGPRGGRFRYTESGNKSYVRKGGR